MIFLGPAFVAFGGLLLLLSYLAERYHSRAFQAHVSYLEAAKSDHEIEAEITRFHSDSSVELAGDIIFWGNIGGITSVGIGVVILLAP